MFAGSPVPVSSINPIPATQSLQNPEPVFSRTFDGQIWQVLTDAEHDLLVAEIRHPNRTVSFAALDLQTRQWLWHGFVLPESWWSSAVLLRSGILFVQAFPEGQNPEPRGITALDIRTRRICWADPDARFAQAAGGAEIIVKHTGGSGETHFLRDAKTGETLREISAENWPQPPPLPSVERLRFPVHYPPASPHSASIADFLLHNLGISPQLSFDYAETEHCIVISYYLRTDGQMQNLLVVFDIISRLPILHETLATRRAGIGRETFFIFNNLLVFVKEQTSIMCYEL